MNPAALGAEIAAALGLTERAPALAVPRLPLPQAARGDTVAREAAAPTLRAALEARAEAAVLPAPASPAASPAAASVAATSAAAEPQAPQPLAPGAQQPQAVQRTDVPPFYAPPSAPFAREPAAARRAPERERRAPPRPDERAAREARAAAAAARAHGVTLRPAASPAYDFADDRGGLWALLTPCGAPPADLRRAVDHLAREAFVLVDGSALDPGEAAALAGERVVVFGGR